jgi:hypothetical protein
MEVTARVREYHFRPLSLADRLRVLFTGRIFAYVGNGKAHTTVVLATRRAKEVGQRG